jgi:hypothetical protein
MGNCGGESVLLEAKLRGMHPQDHQSIISVFFVPELEVWESADTVDAGVSPPAKRP